MPANRLYFKNLDSIRFVAAFMVFLSHGTRSYTFLGIEGTFLFKVFATISSGGVGVSIFFVLSGFLITYLLISENELTGQISLKNFYIRRMLRIWPLYYAVVLFTFFLYPMLKDLAGIVGHSQANVLYHLVFLSNFDVINIEKYFPGRDVASQNITWSVSVEEQFYLFWPLIFAFLPRKGWVYCISAIILGSLAFRIVKHEDISVLYFSTFSVLLDLGIGGLFAYFIKTDQRVRTFFESIGTPGHFILFAFSFSLLLWGDSIFTFKYGNAISRLFFSFSFAMIIAAQAITLKDSPLNLGKFSFANKWGKYTYGIYLLHPIAITLLDVMARLLHITIDNLPKAFINGVTAFFLTLLISWVSYEFFESKFLALKEKFAVIKTH
jgi:peptidoglycan/LPS O-acetylase OafA/YrhL